MSTLLDATLKGFLEKLGSDAPAPGGGSAAALSGAMGAALVSMVCNLTRGKEKYAEFEPLVLETVAKSDALTRTLMDCVQKDTTAFDGVIAALKMPKGSDAEKSARTEAIQKAYKTAILSPEETAEHCLTVMGLAKELLHKSNKNVASDLSVAALQAHAGLVSAIENVAINLPAIKDAEYVAQRRAWIERVEREGAALLTEVRDGVASMIAQA